MYSSSISLLSIYCVDVDCSWIDLQHAKTKKELTHITATIVLSIRLLSIHLLNIIISVLTFSMPRSSTTLHLVIIISHLTLWYYVV